MTSQQSKTVTRRAFVGLVSATGMSLALAACTSSGKSNGSLILNTGGTATGLTRVFNPYLATNAEVLGSGGMIYEPLVQVNPAKANDIIPWLAKSWTWSNDNKTLEVKLQPNVKWSDGVAFTADDVVFSYNLVNNNGALNLFGVYFETVTAVDPHTVRFTYSTPAQQDLPTNLGLSIVSKHKWQNAGDPSKFEDANPVGTGPFVLSTFSPQSYLLLKNKSYWQTGKPKIGGIRFTAYADDTSYSNAIISGQLDWAGDYIPNVQKSYLARSKDNQIYWPIVGTDGLITNNAVFPFNSLNIRKAVSLALDRKQIASSRGSQPATSPTGLPMPAFRDVLAPKYKDLEFKQDVNQAIQLIEGEGFTKHSDGYYYKGSQQLAFTITIPSAYTDQVAPAQVIISQLKDVGIKVAIDGVAVNDINNLTESGKYQASIGYPINNPVTAWQFYNWTMNPAWSKPVGQVIASGQNINRFEDATAAKLFQQYPYATSASEQQDIINQMQEIFVEQVPWIVLFYWNMYGEWDASKATGFPTASNPYFSSQPNPVVAVRLEPK